MRPGELLCAVTDGVTEAANRAGALYGSARVQAILPGLGLDCASVRDVVDALRADVEAFAAGAEPADDLTILAFRWPRRRTPTRDGAELGPGGRLSPSPGHTFSAR